MYFRSQRKLQGEVSLSDAIDTDKEGGSLYLLDVVGADDTMLSDLQDREEQLLLRRLVRDCLTEREADIIRRRYGLVPQTSPVFLSSGFAGTRPVWACRSDNFCRTP